MKMRFLWLITLVMVALGMGEALGVPVKATQRTTFDFGWKFQLCALNDSSEEYAKEKYSDGSWRKLDLPHDWGIESDFLPGEPNETGKLPWNKTGWYRKSFKVPAGSKGNLFFIDFDGVMMTPKVWVNGKFAGEWAYGYNSFRVDITKFLKFGGENVIAVRAQNKPSSTRWYPGAGIYRHTWLVECNPVHIAHWGVYVTTPNISGLPKIQEPKKGAKMKDLKASKAEIDALVEVTNAGTKAENVEVLLEVYNPKIRDKETKKPRILATSKIAEKSVPAGATVEFKKSFPLASPALWDVLSPNLHVLRTTISVGGKIVDRQSTNFGVRKSEWKADGYYLNGRKVYLKGVCQHHDMGPLGSAVHTRALERQIEVLKSFGTNSIRTSHNPPAPEFLDLCDKMGILVDNELFDIWKQQKYDKSNGYHVYWPNWWKKDVANFMRRDRNHASVICWSAGNEISEQGNAEGKQIAKDLVAEMKKYDKTRPITCGCNDLGAASNGFGDIFDVYGFNYKPGNYQGYAKRKRPFIGSETSSCVSTRGVYFFPPMDQFWNRNAGMLLSQVSSYDLYATGWACAPDVEFAAQDNCPEIAGEWVWTGFDYIGEPTPYNQDASNVGNFRNLPKEEQEKLMKEMAATAGKSNSRSSYFGIVDLCGFWKDRTYMYQSHWMPDVPMVHILPHWNWKGDREGKITPVHVYSSGDEVELKLNGKSLGKKKRNAKPHYDGSKDMFNAQMQSNYRFCWNDVKYAPGTLEAIAYKKGKKWATATVKTTGTPAKLSAEVDRATIAGDGRDLAYVTILVQDKEGLTVPTANNNLTFKLSGDCAEIVGLCNGDPTDLKSLKNGKEMKAFSGMCQAVIRSVRGKSGKATLSIKGEKVSGSAKVEITVTKPTEAQLKH